MLSCELLHKHLSHCCPEIHNTRLQAVMDVATGLQKSKNLSLTAIGRSLESDSSVKHRIKKVDRLMGNRHLYSEITSIYSGLSSYVLKYISQNKQVPIIVDLCFMKDSHEIQMLSAEVAFRGRSIPIYREVFAKNELKKRAPSFILNLSKCIPNDRSIVVIMDAGFGEDWFNAIESKDWYWLVRARGKKFIKLSKQDDWADAREVYSKATTRAKHYPNAYITKKKPRLCRVVIKSSVPKQTRKKPLKTPRDYNAGSGNYQRSSTEPWVLVTNLPTEYTATNIVNYYKKRMQIEESFRDIKSHQFGLGARYIRTRCIYRWGIAMLLAAIVQITLWIIGVIGHSEGFQKYFQANTVKDKKIFSYFTLGSLIIKFNKLDDLKFNYDDVPNIVEKELARDW